MRLRDLAHGEPVRGRFRLVHGQPPGHWLDRVLELELQDERHIGFLAPAEGAAVRAHQVADPIGREARELVRRLELASSTVIVQVTRIDGSALELTGRLFSIPAQSIPVSLEVQVSDEFLEHQVMPAWRRVVDFPSARHQLSVQFLLEELNGWFITSGPRDQELERGFSVLGRSFRLDVAPVASGGLVARRLVRTRPRGDRRVLYMREPLQFTDRTVAGLTQAAAVTALQRAVQGSSSWIAGWKQYNEEERRVLEERFGVLPDLRYEGRPRLATGSGEETLFDINLAPGAEIGRWRRAISGEGVLVNAIRKDVSPDSKEQQAPPDGKLIGFDLGRRIVRVSWLANGSPPTDGLLHASSMLEQARLRKREYALQRLEAAKSALPYLGVMLEAQTEARDLPPLTPRPLSRRARQAFRGHDPTQDQAQAIQIAQTSPDITLILGPPGTGKTRVIQALLAMLNDRRDGSEEARDDVLVTSFQQEAVDNAIEGVQFAGIPIDRRGGPHGEDRGAEAIARWCLNLAEQVKQQLPAEPVPTRVLADRISSLLSHWRQAPSGREGSRQLLDEIRRLASPLLRADRVAEIEGLLASKAPPPPPSRPLIDDSDLAGRVERLLEAQRITREPFLSDGPFHARRLKRFLGPWLEELPADVAETLELTASDEPSLEREPWRMLEAACRSLRGLLLEPPRVPDLQEPELADHDVEACVLRVLEDLRRDRANAPELQREALELFLRDLELPEEVREAVQRYTPIQAATCGQADSRRLGLSDRRYVVVLVDEAARANPLDLLIPLVKGRRIILVGDHRQLPHVLEPRLERSLLKNDDVGLRAVYRTSLFERLWEFLPRQTAIDGIPRVAELTDQFRMHPVIGDFIGGQFYDGKLRSRTTAADRPNRVGCYGGHPVAWIDVPFAQGGEERVGTSFRRRVEVRRILEELRRILPPLAEACPDPDPEKPEGRVGVIAFYAAQEAELLEGLSDPQLGLPEHLRERVRVGTVDAFQGREYEAVLLSTVRSNRQEAMDSRLGFTALPNRLCVAFSRARNVLVVVGDARCVAGVRENGQPWSAPMHAFLDLCQRDGYVTKEVSA